MTDDNWELALMHEPAKDGEAEPGTIFDRVSALIEQTRRGVAAQANAALTLMNWHIGRMIDIEILKEVRAGYGQEAVASLAPQLTTRFGRGFDRTSLTRMVRFAQRFPDPTIVASLGQQLSWTHFTAILPVKTPEARAFYVQEAIARRTRTRSSASSCAPNRAGNRWNCWRCTRTESSSPSTGQHSLPRTSLRPRSEKIYREAQERIAHRQITPAVDESSDE